jgi:hypothetical protein
MRTLLRKLVQAWVSALSGTAALSPVQQAMRARVATSSSGVRRIGGAGSTASIRAVSPSWTILPS